MSWGLYDLDSRTVADAMRDRSYSDSVTITGDQYIQASEIWELWQDFQHDVRKQRAVAHDLVIEDYVIRVGHAPGTKDLISVWVARCFCGYAFARDPDTPDDIVFQLPSDAMRFNNQKMLRPWGAWIVGKEHERSAFAHAGLRLMKVGLN